MSTNLLSDSSQDSDWVNLNVNITCSQDKYVSKIRRLKCNSFIQKWKKNTKKISVYNKENPKYHEEPSK